jgi:5-amino-6-(5-phosphoribosylamino)uracil reductase
MAERPYTILSVAVSLDGYIDDTGPSRLVLSGEADLARVGEVRAGVDAILVGAATVRRDNPRLVARGGGSPKKVVVSGRGNLAAEAAFFATGAAE